MTQLDPSWDAALVDRSELGVGQMLPSGTVTLLMADIEGSTRLWDRRCDEMTEAIARLDEAVSHIVAEHQGARPVEQGEGDSFVAAFARPSDAIACAVELQRAPLAPIRLRIGLHTGEVQLRDEGNYIGPTINRAARIRDLAHGGQTVLSSTSADLVVDRLPDDMWLTELGSHQLRDLPRPEQVVQLCHPDLRNEFPPLRTAKIVGAQRLPIQLTSFVGRDTEMRDVPRILQDNRLVTLTGDGGVGKTRLAVQIASQLMSGFGDGVWFVDLAPVADAGAVPDVVARVLGLPDLPGRSTEVTVLEFLASRQAMLVLDNCEHLLDASSELVAAILASCPEITILATSREPIGIAGEAIWRVASLSLADAAVDLFVERARQVRPDFGIADADDARAVAEICRRLDGMPMAIELAAARVRVLSLAEIVDSLHDRFRLLTGGARGAVRRQQTLRASVDWSYELLIEPERILLRRLAVFPGGFDLDAARAVADGDEVASHQVLDILTLLVDKSLVVAETAKGRTQYRMLETIRQYAQEKLGESGDTQALRGRHRDHYATVAARLDTVGHARLDSLVAEVEVEFDNLQAAFTWSRDNGETEHALRLTSALLPLWMMRCRLQQGLAWFDAILEDDDTREPDVSPAVWARALADYAALNGVFAPPDVIEGAERAVAIARELDDPALLVRTLTSCNAGCYDGDAAAPYVTELIDRARDLGDDWRLSQALTWRGYAAIASGYSKAARSDAEEGLRLAEMTGDGFYARMCREWLGFADLYEGDLAAAAAQMQEVASDSRAAHDGLTEVIALAGLGFALACRGEPEAARAVAETAIERSTASGGFDGDVARSVLALAAISGGDVASAVAACEAAWRVRKTGRETFLLCVTPMTPTALASGDVTAARKWADETLSRSTGWHKMRAHTDRARVAMVQGEYDLAEQDAHDALRVAVDIESILSVPDALECLAELSAVDAQPHAARLFGAADAIRERHGIGRFKIYQSDYESVLNQLRNTLGDNDFETARAEGAALSIDEAVGYAQRGRGERKRPSTGWASLTPTEHDVIKLVSQGLTNKDIAARLFVSPRTVQTHLTHTYAKLGLGSRVQLVQEAARHD